MVAGGELDVVVNEKPILLLAVVVHVVVDGGGAQMGTTTRIPVEACAVASAQTVVRSP